MGGNPRLEGLNMKIGDRIKVKIATRAGWIRGWRVVNGFDNAKPTIRAHGWGKFVVRPHEILAEKE
jgi:hypothetical protein